MTLFVVLPMQAFLYAPYLVLAPLHILIVLALLWWYIGLGPSCLAGLGLFILWIPMQLVLSKMYARLRYVGEHIVTC